MNGVRYLLNEHLFGVRAPADNKICTAICQALPCDLDEELEVTRTTLELLYLGKQGGTWQVRYQAMQNVHVFIA